MGSGISYSPGRSEENNEDGESCESVFIHPLIQKKSLQVLCKSLKEENAERVEFLAFLQDETWLEKINIIHSASEISVSLHEQSASVVREIRFNDYIVSPVPTVRPVEAHTSSSTRRGSDANTSKSIASSFIETPIPTPATSSRKDLSSSRPNSLNSSQRSQAITAPSSDDGDAESSTEKATFLNNLQTKMTLLQNLKKKEGVEILSFLQSTSESGFSEEHLKNIMIVAAANIYLRDRGKQKQSPILPPTDATCIECHSPRALPPHVSKDLQAIRRAQRMLKKVLVGTTDLELLKLLIAGDWIEDAVAAVDNLDFSVNISLKKRNRFYPLVYVNTKFEEMTMYSRGAVLGKTCKFLQDSNTESDQAKLMVDSIENDMSVKVVINNVRQDGTDFVNLVSLWPVFSESSFKCKFVIGAHYDASDVGASIREIKMIDNNVALIRLLMQ